MVERFLGVEEVVGSNPAAPTNVGLIAFTFIVKAFFMFKRKLGHAGKYYNALDKSLGKTNLINLEPIWVLFICVNLHKSVIQNTKNPIKM